MSDEEETESESGDEEEEEEEKEEKEKEPEVEEDDGLESLNLGKEQIKLLRGAFTAFDHEKKGVLGMEMIGIILELLGHTLQQNELEDIIREVDADGSGELEFEEFCILASKFLPEDSEEENPEQLTVQLKEAFRFYDKGGNGYITVKDFTEMLRELDPEIPEDEIQGMVREIDQDDSGTVDFDEFMTSLI